MFEPEERMRGNAVKRTTVPPGTSSNAWVFLIVTSDQCKSDLIYLEGRGTGAPVHTTAINGKIRHVVSRSENKALHYWHLSSSKQS